MMIAYKLWYVSVSLDPVACHEVILQELPHIHRGDPRLEAKKESSADHIDDSCRIRPCLPRIPGQSLLYLVC